MSDRFNDMLPYLERLPKEMQEEVLSYIEALLDALEHDNVAQGHLQAITTPTHPSTETWHDPVEAWSDLPDTFLDELDQLRHATPPTPLFNKKNRSQFIKPMFQIKCVLSYICMSIY